MLNCSLEYHTRVYNANIHALFMFMQLYVFINTTKGVDFKWEFVSLFKYSNFT